MIAIEQMIPHYEVTVELSHYITTLHQTLSNSGFWENYDHGLQAEVIASLAFWAEGS